MTLTLPDFALEVYLARYEFSARHYLCGSDAQTLTVRELLDMANDEMEVFVRLSLSSCPTKDERADAIAATHARSTASTS
jgi:hypothetical protein